VTRLAALIEQEQPLRILSTILRKGNFPHALLFTGVEGVGKRTAANAFAAALNCGEPVAVDMPCGRCRACRKIAAGSHPDLLHIEPVGPFIRVGQIRELLDTLAMKPYEAKQRVVILSDAHAMNPEAGNALLKVLEEPPDRTLLVLTARGTADLLPTIVSRCQQIRFNLLSRNGLAGLLTGKENLSPDKADVLASMAGGSYTRARELLRRNWISRRNWLISAGGFLQPAAPAGSAITELMAFGMRLSRKKELLLDALDILKTLFRDLAVVKYGESRLCNRDLVDDIADAARHMSVPAILSKIDAIDTAIGNLRGNANPRLTVEILMMTLAGLCGQSRV